MHPNKQPIDTAPLDGSAVQVIRPHDGKLFDACWEPNGTSMDHETGALNVTGVWMCFDMGWFEQGEVTHWLPKEK